MNTLRHNPNILQRATIVAAGGGLAAVALLGCGSDSQPTGTTFDTTLDTPAPIGGGGSVTDRLCVSQPELCETGVTSGGGSYTPTPEIPDGGGTIFPETPDTTWGTTTTRPGDPYPVPTTDTPLTTRTTHCSTDPQGDCNRNGDMGIFEGSDDMDPFNPGGSYDPLDPDYGE